ncbi:DUF547 domain-containing protein [bacterium]|nr:DUF547 domain-containing protein [bacterium]
MRVIRTMTLLGMLLTALLVNPVLGIDHTYPQWDRILKAVVVPVGPKSQVRYDLLQKNPRELDQFIGDVERVTHTEYQQWSDQQKVAFLINAYNALTIKLILTKYPDLKSIKDLGGFFSGPWKIEFFSLFGEKRNLDYIEHAVLRKDFQEPRIHFALVCASIGCPALRNEAYVPQRLDQQLSDAAQQFLKDRDRNYYDRDSDSLKISSIFKWFKEDFIKTAGSVEAFIAPWITDDDQLRQRIRDRQIELDYLDYDWNLNSTS